jgi:transposase
MAAERLSMRKLRELFRLRFEAKLPWPLPPELDEDAKALAERPEPDWARVHAELQRKGVTKLLLWQEYLEAVPGGSQYSRFCERYGRWLAASSVTLRQEHRAGEKCFVDFSGDGVQVVDAATGEVRVAKLFVAVLGPAT